MILEIVKYPNPILKRKSERVEKITPEIKELIFNMQETLKQAQGVGLAAPQVNVAKRVINVQFEGGLKVFINPEIVRKSRETAIGEEGCLCLPGVYLKVKRSRLVEIAAQDLEGRNFKIKVEGMVARIFQHEIDHLNGLLILDKLPFWQKWKLKARLKIKNK